MRSTLIVVAGLAALAFASPAWSMPSATTPQHGNNSGPVLYVGDRDRDWDGDRDRHGRRYRGYSYRYRPYYRPYGYYQPYGYSYYQPYGYYGYPYYYSRPGISLQFGF